MAKLPAPRLRQRGPHPRIGDRIRFTDGCNGKQYTGRVKAPHRDSHYDHPIWDVSVDLPGADNRLASEVDEVIWSVTIFEIDEVLDEPKS